MGAQNTEIGAITEALAKQRFQSAADARREAPFRNDAGLLRRKVLTNQDAVWCHLGDSTANGTDEWLYLAANVWRTDFPNVKVTHELWNDASQSYDTATALQAGDGGPAPSPVLSDTFSRTSASLSGSTADTGQVWSAGSAGAVGSGVFTASNAVEPSVTHGVDPQGVDGLRATARVTIPAGASTGLVRVYVLRVPGQDEIFAEVLVAASNLTCNLYKRVAGTSTAIGTGSGVISVSNAAARTVDIVVAFKAGEATATFTNGGTTITKSAPLGQAAGWAGFAAAARRLDIVTTATNSTWDYVTVGVNGPDPKTLRIINGSMPGASFTYQQARVDKMVPVAPDLVTFAGSHNNGTQPVAAFQQQTADLVAAVLARYPKAGITLVSQNPQFAPKPADQAAAHNLRIAATGIHAGENGWGYIAAAEKFLGRADRGQAWVMADGIHPDAANGSPAWRDAALAFLRGTA